MIGVACQRAFFFTDSQNSKPFIVGMIMSILDTTIVNVALDTLARDLHSTLSDIQWVATGYLLSLAAVIPLTGWAARKYGAKRVYILSIVLFTLGSALCGIADSSTSLIAFRVLQGIGGGMIMPIGQMIMAEVAGVVVAHIDVGPVDVEPGAAELLVALVPDADRGELLDQAFAGVIDGVGDEIALLGHLGPVRGDGGIGEKAGSAGHHHSQNQDGQRNDAPHGSLAMGQTRRHPEPV